MPGDCYETVGAHRVKVCGPRRCCTPQENAAALGLIKEILARAIDGEMAGEVLTGIMIEHNPLPPPLEVPPWEPGADG